MSEIWRPKREIINLRNSRRHLEAYIRIDPTWQVGASSDDCHRCLSNDGWGLTTTSWSIGNFGGVYWMYGGGGRFINITIPQGATILDGTHLTPCSSGNLTTTGANSRVSAENVDNAPTFADDKVAFDARWANRTAARVDWDNIPNWTRYVWYDSPEIKAVIQEVINRPGWVSGNSIVIFWEDFENRSTGRRAAYSYDASGLTYAPKLVIEYAVPAVGMGAFYQQLNPLGFNIYSAGQVRGG